MPDYFEERAKHYRRIETDPIYRMQEQMLELEAQMLPPISTPREPTPEQRLDKVELLLAEKPVITTPKMWDEIQQIKGRLNFFENKGNAHIDASKRKRKPQYIIKE